MDIGTLRDFFMWCTIINAAVLVVFSLACIAAGNLVYRIHSKWFAMSRETFNVVIYSFIGLFKTVVIVFNVVPYVALTIVS